MTTVVAIHQPNYLPYLGFFHKLAGADVFVLYDTAQYSKNDYHNRNRVKTPDGPHWITVPVRSPGRRSLLEVEIDASRPWADRHLRTLEANYSRTAHFGETFPGLAEILRRPWDRLVPLNTELIRHLRDRLGLGAEVVAASGLGIDPAASPTEKIVDMVRGVGGSTYLSGPGGRGYLDASLFTDVALRYDDFRPPTYGQPFGAFVPNLSAIDALFCCGTETTRGFVLGPGRGPG